MLMDKLLIKENKAENIFTLYDLIDRNRETQIETIK